MDDTAKLVSELHSKLAELDGKVAAYQRDMLAQFHKHMDDCLKDYPEDVSKEVSRVIAASMSKFPALSPREDGDQSPRSDDLEASATAAWDGRTSPPPILYHTSGIPKEGPRSPHQREREFQGLFTPRYLPLLDSSSRPVQSPPTSPPAEPGPRLIPSLDTPEKVEAPITPAVTTEDTTRPGTLRRLTDKSQSSVDSVGSETKVPRSALRRSLGSNRGSPRRVRFDFEGTEVLPSTSPEKPPTILTLAEEAEGAEAAEAQTQPEAAVLDASTSAIVDESQPYGLAMSLLDVEGEEDSLPRPRKVSSTQALQALTRSPLEAGTWTVVNPDPEPASEPNGDKETDGTEDHQQNSLALRPKPEITIQAQNVPAENQRLDELLGSPIEELEKYNDSDSDSDEEFLSMSTKLSRRTPSPAAPMPIPAPITTTAAKPVPAVAPDPKDLFEAVESPPAAPPKNKMPKEDTGDVFEWGFDDIGTASQSEKYLPDDDDDEHDGKDDEDHEFPVSETVGQAGSAYKPSPIGRNFGNTRPPILASTNFQRTSVGSFNGRSMMGSFNGHSLCNTIKNPKLYEEIANMKGVHVLVGSIDGRTGVDAADPGSYRAALAKAVMGEPRSFTERLALEEAMERRKRGEDDDH